MVAVWSRDSTVCIATGYGLDGRGSNPGRSKISSSTQRPGRPTKPPIQWVSRDLSPGGKAAAQLQLVTRSRMVDLYLHSPICLCGGMLNLVTKGSLFASKGRGKPKSSVTVTGIPNRSRIRYQPNTSLGHYHYIVLLWVSFCRYLILPIVRDGWEMKFLDSRKSRIVNKRNV
jgi:hypothetical protein